MCALSTNAAYFADSTNSVEAKGESDVLLLLAALNSSLLNWRFSLTSTNNNVGTNELDALPFPKQVSPAASRTIIALVVKLQSMKFRRSADVIASPTYAELDSEIMNLYELSAAERKLIK